MTQVPGLPLMIALLLAAPVTAAAQMTFRLRGTVHDNDGKPVAGLTVRAEALQGFRGEQFVGQKGIRGNDLRHARGSLIGVDARGWALP